MNLTEFVRKNDIKCSGGEEFRHRPEFFRMKEFERACHVIYGVPFLEPEETDAIEDAAPAGKSVDEAVQMFDMEKERFEFFKRYDLIDTGRYWLNRDLERCLVDEGKVVVVD